MANQSGPLSWLRENKSLWLAPLVVFFVLLLVILVVGDLVPGFDYGLL